MKKFGKHKTIWLAAAAAVLTGSLCIQNAMAYFTTYVTARGGHPISLGTTTEVREEVQDMTKHIIIANSGEGDCWVRVRIFTGSQFQIAYSGAVDEAGGQYWTLDGDNYWYYKDIVPAGGETEVLLAKIEVPENYTESFDVVVVQESTPVLYREDGTPYADWDLKADTKTDIGTANGEGVD